MQGLVLSSKSIHRVLAGYKSKKDLGLDFEGRKTSSNNNTYLTFQSSHLLLFSRSHTSKITIKIKVTTALILLIPFAYAASDSIQPANATCPQTPTPTLTRTPTSSKDARRPKHADYAIKDAARLIPPADSCFIIRECS